MVQKTTKEKTKKVSKKTPEPVAAIDHKSIATELVELNKALVKEIDNLFRAGLPAAQVGKILGDVISSFSKHTDEIKERI